MKITRLKALVMGVLALIVVGVGAAIGYVTLIDVKELRYGTQAEMRGALAGAAQAELQARGVSMRNGLSCQDMPGWNKEKMRAACTGRTGDKKRVQVIASGEDATQDHYYTILVNGRPVVQNARCLGADCHKTD